MKQQTSLIVFICLSVATFVRVEAADNKPPPPPKVGEGDTHRNTTGGQRKPWLQQHGAELANHDGVITLAAMLADMNRAFAIYDRNKDGVITRQELQATGDVREGAAFAGLIYRHFADLDTNGDGNVSRDEMAAAVKYIFNAADLNHDGMLTKAEWQNAPNTPLPIRAGDQDGKRGDNRDGGVK